MYFRGFQIESIAIVSISKHPHRWRSSGRWPSTGLAIVVDIVIIVSSAISRYIAIIRAEPLICRRSCHGLNSALWISNFARRTFFLVFNSLNRRLRHSSAGRRGVARVDKKTKSFIYFFVWLKLAFIIMLYSLDPVLSPTRCASSKGIPFAYVKANRELTILE